jgi:hypothetical protein
MLHHYEEPSFLGRFIGTCEQPCNPQLPCASGCECMRFDHGPAQSFCGDPAWFPWKRGSKPGNSQER